MMMISQKNHLVSKTKKGQQRQRPCFSKRSLIFLWIGLTLMAEASEEKELLKKETYKLKFNGETHEVEVFEPDKFRTIRSIYIRNNKKFVNEMLGVEKANEEKLLQYIKDQFTPAGDSGDEDTGKETRAAAASGSMLMFSDNQSLILKNLNKNDRAVEWFSEPYMRYVKDHHKKRKDKPHIGYTGLCDNLCIFRNVADVENRTYFVVMANVFQPGMEEPTDNEIVNAHFRSNKDKLDNLVHFTVVDLKGSWADRFGACKPGSEIKEVDLINIINEMPVVFRENEHNAELLREAFIGIYNALEFNKNQNTMDASHMMQIALQPTQFYDIPEGELTKALAKKRTLCAEPLQDKDANSPRNGLRLLFRPTRILDHFQTIGDGKQKWWDKAFKTYYGPKEGSRIPSKHYYRRALGFFNHFFRIIPQGKDVPEGCFNRYELGGKGRDFLQEWDMNPMMGKKNRGKYLGANMKNQIAREAKQLIWRHESGDKMSLMGWFWFIKQRILMDRELPKCFKVNDCFTWLCYQVHLRKTKITPEMMAAHVLNYDGGIVEGCKAILQIFSDLPDDGTKIKEHCKIFYTKIERKEQRKEERTPMLKLDGYISESDEGCESIQRTGFGSTSDEDDKTSVLRARILEFEGFREEILNSDPDMMDEEKFEMLIAPIDKKIQALQREINEMLS